MWNLLALNGIMDVNRKTKTMIEFFPLFPPQVWKARGPLVWHAAKQTETLTDVLEHLVSTADLRCA